MAVITALSMLLYVVSFWLRLHSKAFEWMYEQIPPMLGMPIIVTVSVAATFLGAAMLGARLTKIQTGRMPMSKSRSRNEGR